MAMSNEERRQIIAELTKEEELVNKQLQEVVLQKIHLNAKIKSIGKLYPQLLSIQRSAETISNAINETAKLSESVTSKIRQLDIARNRVFECQSRLNDLIDLQLSTSGVQFALHNEDYEKAAGHIYRFLSMDQSLLQQTAADVSGNSSAICKSVTTLQDAASQLNVLIKNKFDEACKNEDLASVERFFKIFPLLGIHDEGLHKFSIHLCAKIHHAAVKNLEAALNTNITDKRANVVYADTLTLLLEGIARIIETHNPLVETYYGPGHLYTVVNVLQIECDKQINKIYNEFVKRRQIPKKMLQINDYIKSSGNKTGMGDKLDPKSLDILIAEMSIMHSRTELYCRFLKRRVLTDLEISSGTTNSSKTEEFKSMIKNSVMCRCMHELISNYILFEQFFMEESVKKAVSMDMLEDGQQTSSMVDDVFFIVKKSIRRAISTSSLDGICAVINNACGILEGQFCPVLREQLSQGYPSGYLDLTQAYNVLQTSIQQGRIQSGNDFDQARIMFIVYLNNADISSEYVDTLCNTLLDEINNALPTMTENDRGKLESCLSGLASVIANLKSVVEYGMQQLKMSVIKPRINPWVDDFLKMSHELTEDELSEYEAHETFVQVLITHFEVLLNSFRNLLTTNNFDTLVEMLTIEVTLRLEKVIFKSKFNRLGGLILDKEIRSLASYLTSATSWSVREKFTRLIQIATILNMEHLSEISDYEGEKSGGFTWHLSKNEIKLVISLRTDFSADEIYKLKF